MDIDTLDGEDRAALENRARLDALAAAVAESGSDDLEPVHHETAAERKARLKAEKEAADAATAPPPKPEVDPDLTPVPGDDADPAHEEPAHEEP